MEEFVQLFENACANGDLETVNKCYEEDEILCLLNCDDNIKIACQNNHLEIIDFLLNINYEDESNKRRYITICFNEACNLNHIKIIKYLCDNYHHEIKLYKIEKNIIKSFENEYYDIIDYVIPFFPNILYTSGIYDFHNNFVMYIVSNNLFTGDLLYLLVNLCTWYKFESCVIYFDCIGIVIDKCKNECPVYSEIIKLFRYVCYLGLLDVAKLFLLT